MAKKAKKSSDKDLWKLITRYGDAGEDPELLAMCFAFIKMLHGACSLTNQAAAFELLISIMGDAGTSLDGSELEELGRTLRKIKDAPSEASH